MKSIPVLIVVFSFWALMSCNERPDVEPVEDIPVAAENEEYYPGMLNVKFSLEMADSLRAELQRGGDPWAFTLNTKAAGRVLSVLGEAEVEPLFNEGGKYAGRRREAGLHQWFRLKFDTGTDIRELLKVPTRSSVTGIECIEPVYKMVFQAGQRVDARVWGLLRQPFKAPVMSLSEMPFNDPHLNEQWHYDQGKFSAIKESGIGLFKAWEKSTGSPDVIVAVLDEGIDYAHEDLAGNMWVNQAELGGREYFDDDGNAYDDDIYGYNFPHRSGKVTPMEHGTHVAGTIAAVNNNGKGVCGIAGGSGHQDGVKVMACQIAAPNTGMRGAEDAFAYAADNGAVICSCSWYVIRAGDALKEAIDYFNVNGGKNKPDAPMQGGVVFFAAGNDNRTNKLYPPAWDNVVAVSSVDAGNRRSYFSNYGDWVDLAAPGGGNDTEAAANILSTLPGNEYGYLMGTSMACPHVAGIAALVVAQHAGEPDFTSERLKEILLQSVTDLSSFEPDAALMGKGLIRADLAVGAVEGLNIVPAAPEEVRMDIRLQPTLTWKVRADKNGNLPTAYLVYADAASGEKKLCATLTDIVQEDDEMSCSLKAFTVNDKYEITVRSRNQWGKLSAPSQALTVEWNNDYTAPEVVTNVRISREAHRYKLLWKQVADAHDGSAVAYNVSARDKDLRVLLDTVVWYGKVPVGQELTFETEFSASGEGISFMLIAIDEWNNWGKESRGFKVGAGTDSHGIYAFPNPAVKETTLVWENEWNGEKIITVYDVAGRLIYKKRVNAVETSCPIDCSAWSPGWYAGRLESGGRTESFTVRKL